MNDLEVDDIFVSGEEGLDSEFDKLKSWWKNILDKSFKKVSNSKRIKSGVCEEVKELMTRERWIKENILTNPDRGRMIFQVRSQINQKIAENSALAMEESIRKVTTASNPYAEVYKIRKRMKRSEAVGFPLKTMAPVQRH